MWVPLHVHSEFSILDATASVQGIAEKTAAYGMPAAALTDHGNLYGAIDFYKACKDVKVKPILGFEAYVAPESRLEKKKEYGQRTNYHLGLLAKNKQGYQNLCKLSSIGYMEGFYYHPRIDEELLSKHAEGVICLSGCMSSKVAQEALHGNRESLLKTIQWYRNLFGEDYYLELQRHPMSAADLQADGMHQESWLYQQYLDYIANQEKLNQILLEIAKEQNIKVVATNDSHYLEREDWKAHEILLNIQSGEPCELLEMDAYGNPKRRVPNPKRRTYASHECYFKSPEQMAALFSNCPEALANTLEVAEKCKLDLDFKAKHYPVYTPPENKAVEAFLWELCEEGIKTRYTPERLAKVQEIYPGKDPMQVVRDRLAYEMNVIVPKGMCDYLLIVWDFIYWAKKSGIPMGPGRGSGAGSIVCYLTGITDIEPLRFHLFFERFINPERISYPDIDVDMCMDKRGEVINYVMHKYGKENIAQIITFNTMKARSAIKDVARVLSVPLPKVNEITKLVPEELDITLEKALEKDPELRHLYETDAETKRIIDYARRLEGCVRNTGIHAAGIIISGQPLTNLIPVCVSKDSEMPVTQYSMKPVEMVGMLKMDFLGLTTLTCIQICVTAIQMRTGKLIDWVNLPLDDKPSFDILNQGKTSGIFQLESGGMQDLARNLHLDKFEEIIAVGALYRPGPMDMIPSFIDRKHGREKIEYDHPWMSDILSETYGIMVYQEQVMQIAQKLANFSLGEGDVLRRAMGKKDHDQMVKQREKFRTGALQNSIDEQTSMMIFDKIEKFASYGFNKAHAAAYGYLSYVTAYFKANYPKEWMASLMTCVSHDLTKVSKFIRECLSMDIRMLPPDINEAGQTFTASPEGIRFAMAGIKGVGEGVVESILQERQKGGHFTSLYQFLKRMDLKKVGKKQVELLVDAGGFDFTGWTRDALKQSVDPMYEAVASQQKEASYGFMDLFASKGDLGEAHFSKQPKVKLPRSKYDLLLKEKELLGFFLTGHPMDEYKPVLKRLSCVGISKMDDLGHDTVFRSAFLVETMSIKFSSKSQKKFAILNISDGYDSFELPIWPEMYEEKAPLLKENQLLYAVLQVDRRDESPKLSCRWLEDLMLADEKMIEECDKAYDKAKYMAARMANIPKKETTKKAEKVKEVPSKFTVALEANKTRLSHVLQLKKIFEAHAGEVPVMVHFHNEDKHVATLHPTSALKVAVTAQLKQDLKQIPSVIVNDER